VARLYEAYPYPRYPLLAKPRWQEGFLSSSAFAARLAGVSGAPAHRGRAEVLIGGAGEILPYVIRKWEPARNRVTCLDLCRTSLARARWRLFPSLKPTAFVHGDLAAFLTKETERFTHIDAYGVLHHLADPLSAVKALAKALRPGGTARVMVYNSPARARIRELQRALALIGLDAFKAADLAAARNLLELAGAELPALAARLAQIGPGTLRNDARLVDTFLHAREARIGPAAWFEAFAAAGLKITGLVDRYAELDDLPNPLWRAPTAAEIVPRAHDRRFENNLELFLQRVPGPAGRETLAAAGRAPWRLLLKSPPKAWFSYDETRAVPLATRIRLWHAHVRWVFGGVPLGKAPWLKQLTAAAKGRLARVGALLPGQVGNAAEEAVLAAPLSARMETPPKAPRAVISPDGLLAAAVARALETRGRNSARRLRAGLARRARAPPTS
jgi:SAM-dependent methyltransferase